MMVVRMAALTLAALLWTLLAGCSMGRSTDLSELRVSHLPPDETDILEALIRSEGVPLTVHPLCQEIAGTAEDKTIGRFVAGLLATQVQGRQNSISVTVQEAFQDGDWMASIVFSSGDAGDPYHWGVEFQVRRSDGLVIQDSFRCFIPWW